MTDKEEQYQPCTNNFVVVNQEDKNPLLSTANTSPQIWLVQSSAIEIQSSPTVWLVEKIYTNTISIKKRKWCIDLMFHWHQRLDGVRYIDNNLLFLLL